METPWAECLPLPETPKKTTSIRLDPQLIEEIDTYRHLNRWEMPWLTATRSAFLETAARFLLKTLKTGPTAVF